jgi:hypothetical protein
MDMFDEGIHILDIHLSVSIKTDESFDFQFITVFLDEIISGLIRCTASPIDRMIKDDDEVFRMLLFLIFEHLQCIIARAVIDKDQLSEPCMDNLIDDFADLFFLVIDPDIEDKIIFFSLILPMSDLMFILFISLIDSRLGNESGQLESIFGMFIEYIDIEVE